VEGSTRAKTLKNTAVVRSVLGQSCILRQKARFRFVAETFLDKRDEMSERKAVILVIYLTYLCMRCTIIKFFHICPHF